MNPWIMMTKSYYVLNIGRVTIHFSHRLCQTYRMRIDFERLDIVLGIFALFPAFQDEIEADALRIRMALR